MPKTMRQNQPVVLKNSTCCYCRTPLAGVDANKEHVIARRFVPKGTLQGSWNMIAKACLVCNGRKSDLEDDMGVLSLQHYPFGQAHEERDGLARQALAKASRTFSRHARKVVSESAEETKLEMSLGPSGHITFGMVSPPQVSDDRAFALANMQAQAFYYLLSYDDEAQRGGIWPGGGFFTADVAARRDWGNPRQRWFIETASAWSYRLVATAAQGFFKVAIRRSPDVELWSCAVEWNEGIRVIAFFGNQPAALALGRSMPPLFGEGSHVIPQPNRLTRFRFEIPLKPEDDRMFYFDFPEHEENGR